MTPETLKAIADRWTLHTTHTTDVPDLVEEIVRQKEQIRRLREALSGVLEVDEPNYASIRDALKETAP